jgi:hypothetical protein
VKTLQDVKEELSKMMEPTKPNPQQNIFNSAGQSKQFNNVGGGAQYNNTAGGNQLHGSSFHQPVYFGRSS